MSGTGVLDLPVGTTAQRAASHTSGIIRFYTDLGQFEGYDGSAWSSIGGWLPQNARTSAYTLVATDSGKHISITTGGVTVPASVFAVGEAITIYNNSASNQAITQGASVTLRQAGTTLTGNRTLGAYGVATLLCVGTNTFVISGAGLT
jgi:hypothetical protein